MTCSFCFCLSSLFVIVVDLFLSPLREIFQRFCQRPRGCSQLGVLGASARGGGVRSAAERPRRALHGRRYWEGSVPWKTLSILVSFFDVFLLSQTSLYFFKTSSLRLWVDDLWGGTQWNPFSWLKLTKTLQNKWLKVFWTVFIARHPANYAGKKMTTDWGGKCFWFVEILFMRKLQLVAFFLIVLRRDCPFAVFGSKFWKNRSLGFFSKTSVPSQLPGCFLSKLWDIKTNSTWICLVLQPCSARPFSHVKDHVCNWDTPEEQIGAAAAAMGSCVLGPAFHVPRARLGHLGRLWVQRFTMGSTWQKFTQGSPGHCQTIVLDGWKPIQLQWQVSRTFVVHPYDARIMLLFNSEFVNLHISEHNKYGNQM